MKTETVNRSPDVFSLSRKESKRRKDNRNGLAIVGEE
jgi:hypothetical protein